MDPSIQGQLMTILDGPGTPTQKLRAIRAKVRSTLANTQMLRITRDGTEGTMMVWQHHGEDSGVEYGSIITDVCTFFERFLRVGDHIQNEHNYDNGIPGVTFMGAEDVLQRAKGKGKGEGNGENVPFTGKGHRLDSTP